jgi:hypothetical protein
MKYSKFRRFDGQYVRMVWMILSVALFVLGAGAPGGAGGLAGG